MVVSVARNNALRERLQQREQTGLLRQRIITDVSAQPFIRSGGKAKLNLSSNDYLGLSNHPEVIKAFQMTAERYGVGSGSSQMISGYSTSHQDLEAALADFTGFERVVLFGNSYLANLGWQQALADKHSTILHDRVNHASLMDGSKLIGARIRRYRHRDSAHLEELLKRGEESQDTIVATDTVFSMDGDIADIKEIHNLCNDRKALMVVDDTHGLGVLGQQGRGIFDGSELYRSDVYVAGFGKALGVYGGCLAGSHALMEGVVQYSGAMHYSTSLPVPIVVAVLKALELIQSEGWRREKLEQLINDFSRYGDSLGLPFLPSSTPIQSLLVGDTEKALRLAEALRAEGYFVTAIRPPTVPRNSARIRVSIRADHSADQLQAFLSVLHELMSTVG